jgi:hypothetical protein
LSGPGQPGILPGMPSTNGTVHTEPGTCTAQVAAAEHVAATIVGAFEACELSGAPLTQAQKIAVIETALLEFDGFAAHLRMLELVDEAFGRLDPPRRLNGKGPNESVNRRLTPS